MTPHLVDLDLEGCNEFVELHLPIECPNLKFLNLSGSKVSNLNLGMTSHLEALNLEGCSEFEELHLPIEFPNLKFLTLSGSKVSNLNLGMTPQLKKLNFEGCNEFVELHLPIECPNLNFLNLSGSKVSNLNLGMTPQLKVLNLEGCHEFVELHLPIECPNLKFLNLSGSKRHERIGHKFVATPELSAESLDICPLHPNNNLPMFRIKCKKYDEPQGWRGNLEKLISFGHCAYTNLEPFLASICGLQKLTKLTLEGNIPKVPKDLYQLESLEEVSLSMKEIDHLPDSICLLKHLKYLNLKSCWLLKQLPKDLGQLECLEKLILTECLQLRDIPHSICRMKNLIYLDLRYCILVEKLPEELGRLECLKELDIEGAGISRLPQSIFQLKHLCIFGSRWRLESIVTEIKLSIFCSNNRFKFGPFFCLYVVHYMERM
ncbi:hypothetical protein L1987_64655 [Smallanthus sonchifolius]|uniref:Uncharacterized protein n=1 Tax=Smallanthus sonchifolius TaxID=185202 RepID=A0ACB9BSC3_9ASTR|nr:hypothetical protein L1987_64655 [Smallanthus sonchifolius]